MSRERWNEHIREALAEVEEQRDDAVVYLSAIKVLLDLLARGHAVRQCGQEIAEALVQQLGLETCAVGLSDEADSDLTLVGFATQAQRLGGPRGGLGESGWLALARLVKPGVSPTCFRRRADGSFDAVALGELAGEGFLVLPFAVSGEAGGALVLHSLVSPAQVFTRGRALSLLGEIVGQVLTIARMRASVAALCGDLEGELGVTRRALSDQQQSLRAHEENIHTLTQALIRSNRVKREFLGTVSHELRTPLNAILGYTALVRDGTAGTVSGEQATLPERVSELFELFAQGDSSATRRFTGLGMGLTLVQRCARLLGGEVRVESQPGAGSEFRVRIPDALAVTFDDERPATAPRLMH